MDEARGIDISKIQLDLVDMSANDHSLYPMGTSEDDDSLHPTTTKTGFCVKEYEEEMQSLTKENFNLKLRIYFLEEKNPNIPEGAENLYKQNIDLKIENQTLMKDLQDKQDLLCQASKALEMLDTEKTGDLQRSQMIIDELNQKVESLQHEVSSLQNALVLVDNNKSSVLVNDTGYADFLGAVDSKDIDYQRKMMELNDIEANFNQQINEMNQKVRDLHQQKDELKKQTQNLLYENDEMKDKMGAVQKQMHDQATKLEAELHEFKQKWAASQCDLQDAEEKLRETEKERQKTLSILKATLENLEKERLKINDLENRIADTTSMHKDNSRNESGNLQQMLMSKNEEISLLRDELHEAKRLLKDLTNTELKEKNREIEKLNRIVNNMKDDRNTSASCFSLEKLSESFNDLKFHQAMEEKKKSQQKIEDLMNELSESANVKTKQHVQQLQQQMAIVVEKQEVSDGALGKCAELCAYTLEHLQGLSQFLSALLQQKNIRESLSEKTMLDIQSAIEKTLELSQNVSRFSDARMSSLPNISSLDLLMTTARDSLANIRELQCFSQGFNKSIQVSNDRQIEELQEEMEATKTELVDMNRVNQLLEDEICNLKVSLIDYKQELLQRDEEVKDLKSEKNDLNSKLKDSQKHLHDLILKRDDLEDKLQEVTVQKFRFESQLIKSDDLANELTTKLQSMQEDLAANWITKSEHQTAVERLKEDVVNGEAQLAAVRMEMDSLCNNMDDMKLNEASPNLASATSLESLDGEKENLAVPKRKTLEISDDRRLLLTTSQEVEVAGSSSTDCPKCPKYRGEIYDLKKYLSQALKKIKFERDAKARTNLHIQKQLSSTETFIASARSNMETILMSRNLQQE